MPFEELTNICKSENVLSCIDGAHSIGQIPLNLRETDPDFYVSNCHKWLFVPRGCAVFYVPVRNQALIRSSLPTSHGFVPKETEAVFNPLPPSGKSEFVNQFEFVGTLDNSPYLCVPAGVQWRKKVKYGGLEGEEAIMKHCVDLAKKGGNEAAKTLGTEVMENPEGTLRRCAFANVRLPLEFQEIAAGEMGKAVEIAQYVQPVKGFKKAMTDLTLQMDIQTPPGRVQYFSRPLHPRPKVLGPTERSNLPHGRRLCLVRENLAGSLRESEKRRMEIVKSNNSYKIDFPETSPHLLHCLIQPASEFLQCCLVVLWVRYFVIVSPSRCARGYQSLSNPFAGAEIDDHRG